MKVFFVNHDGGWGCLIREGCKSFGVWDGWLNCLQCGVDVGSIVCSVGSMLTLDTNSSECERWLLGCKWFAPLHTHSRRQRIFSRHVHVNLTQASSMCQCALDVPVCTNEYTLFLTWCACELDSNIIDAPAPAH